MNKKNMGFLFFCFLSVPCFLCIVLCSLLCFIYGNKKNDELLCIFVFLVFFASMSISMEAWTTNTTWYYRVYTCFTMSLQSEKSEIPQGYNPILHIDLTTILPLLYTIKKRYLYIYLDLSFLNTQNSVNSLQYIQL